MDLSSRQIKNKHFVSEKKVIVNKKDKESFLEDQETFDSPMRVRNNQKIIEKMNESSALDNY